jgi:precorrin-2 dehydrogenase/sirohydrochlorin ferrochelatase
VARDPGSGFYMACLDLDGRRCLVVGGGRVAAEKAAGLLACGARVTVVSELLGDDFDRLEVDRRARGYRSDDLEGVFLVMAAGDDTALDERVFADAEARGTLCNVADAPALSNFILPAVHREGPIAVAVSTGGASPALAKRLRDQIADLVEPRHAALALELAALRPAAKRRFATYQERRDYFEALVSERLA